jgi:hypothetical protein
MTATIILPELKRGDVLTDGETRLVVFRRERSSGEFEEPVYVLRSLRSGVKLRDRYTGEGLAGEGFRLEGGDA